MTTNRDRGRWAICFSALGALVMVGALVTSARPAEAQQAPRAPGVADFNRTCGRCHPHGDEDTGPDLHNKNKTVAQMTKIIREGTGKMRPIAPGRLSNAALAQVLIFLRTLHAVR